MAAAQMINHISMAIDRPLDMSIVRGVLVVLVSNTKDKNTAVQADSEWALVALLRLRHGDDFLQVSSLFTLLFFCLEYCILLLKVHTGILAE